MTPIISREQQDTILTSEITQNHIVVGVTQIGNPAILSTNSTGLSFKALYHCFTSGNQFSWNCKSIQENVEHAIKGGWKVAVFHESDWKKALQWLIDNAE